MRLRDDTGEPRMSWNKFAITSTPVINFHQNQEGIRKCGGGRGRLQKKKHFVWKLAAYMAHNNINWLHSSRRFLG
jgi:hypothetical protein